MREAYEKLVLMNKSSSNPFFINDHSDILLEILKQLDARSLGVAACVCRLWCNISVHDSLWENLCFRHVSPPPDDIRHVVLAMGGYRKLYNICLRPLLSRLCNNDSRSDRFVGSVLTRDEVQLSLSLFSVDFYERLGEDKLGDGISSSCSSLMFLCKPVNVTSDHCHY